MASAERPQVSVRICQPGRARLGGCYMNGVDHNMIKLKLFPFSIKDKARNWFHNLMLGSIDTWALVEVFLTKIFPPQLTSQFRASITRFR